MEGTTTQIDEIDFVKKAILFQGHPSLEVLVSPHGMRHYYTGAFHLRLRFSARILADRYSQGDFFWDNKDDCGLSNSLKESTFKILRSFKIAGGRAIHVIKGNFGTHYMDIFGGSNETKVSCLDAGGQIVELGQVRRMRNNKLHVSWISTDTTVYVATFASKSTNISIFGSSSTCGPEEITIFDLQPGIHLGGMLGLLVALHVEATTPRELMKEEKKEEIEGNITLSNGVDG